MQIKRKNETKLHNATNANSPKHSLFGQGQERQMESEDYHFVPTKSKMGDSDELGRIRGQSEKEGLIPVTASPPTVCKVRHHIKSTNKFRLNLYSLCNLLSTQSCQHFAANTDVNRFNHHIHNMSRLTIAQCHSNFLNHPKLLNHNLSSPNAGPISNCNHSLDTSHLNFFSIKVHQKRLM